MRIRIVFVAAVLLAAAAVVHGQAAAAPPPSGNAALTGVWRGEMNGLPAIALVITDEGGSLSGAVLFYFQQRKTVNDPYTNTAGVPEPMLTPSFDGRTLLFSISHRRAHPPRSLNDPPVRFRLTLTAPGKAELVNESERGGPAGLLVRSDY
ncbi:MAG: hypothetical protein WCE75_00965 [Terracidiphilus sp.]